MRSPQILATMDSDIRTSPPWSTYRMAKIGEEVWALPAINMPEEGCRIRWWLSPIITVDAGKDVSVPDWSHDADGPYGVGAYLEDITPKRRKEGEQPEFDEFVEGYVEALLWSETFGKEGEEQPMDDEYGPEDFSPDAVETTLDECWDFWSSNLYYFCRVTFEGYTWSMAGNDFALTRNGHGAGYWDRGLGEIGDKLTEAAKIPGNASLYVGDDGRLYLV